MTSVMRLLAALAAVVVLASAPLPGLAQSLKQPAKPSAKPSAKPAPPAPTAAPRTAVEAKTIPAFVPPGPPPLDDSNQHKPVAAVLKAAQAMNPEEDAARWIDGGPCWVWVGIKRDLPWAKYRFVYQGACEQGRAQGQGVLKSETQDDQGNWTPLSDVEGVFQNGIPLADPKSVAEAKLVIGLPDRSVLSWMGSSLNEEAEVFTVGRADDQGRAGPCSAGQGILAVLLADKPEEKHFKHLLRRSASVVSSQCPQRIRALWLASLTPAEGLILSTRQGIAGAEPTLAQAEIREGLIYAFSQTFSSPPSLAPQTSPAPGAEPLAWTPPAEELDYQLLMVIVLPVILLLLLLAAMRFTRANSAKQR